MYSGGAIALHYDGSTWSTLNVPENIHAFNAVHGNGGEVYFGGETASDQGVIVSSSDLVNWQVQYGSAVASEVTTTSVLWTSRAGALLAGQDQPFWLEEAESGVLDVVSEGSLQGSLEAGGVPTYFRSILEEDAGNFVIGLDGGYGERTSVPGIYRMACE
jgi:hypothetical protein